MEIRDYAIECDNICVDSIDADAILRCANELDLRIYNNNFEYECERREVDELEEGEEWYCCTCNRPSPTGFTFLWNPQLQNIEIYIPDFADPVDVHGAFSLARAIQALYPEAEITLWDQPLELSEEEENAAMMHCYQNYVDLAHSKCAMETIIGCYVETEIDMAEFKKATSGMSEEEKVNWLHDYITTDQWGTTE